MMQAFRTENNYRNASRLSAAELRAAMASREILQSTALAFDTQRQLRFERRSRSILCLRFTAEYLRQPVNGIRNSSGSTAKFFDGLRHIAHSAHVIFLLPWICSAGVRCSGCLPVSLTPR